MSALPPKADIAHCRWLPCRDRAYRTVVPSSARTTTGASTDKISHHTSTRPPKLAAANYDRSRATRRAQRGIVNRFGSFATLAAINPQRRALYLSSLLTLGVKRRWAGNGRCLDVRHTTNSAFKRIKVWQAAKSRRHSREPHDLSAA
jgi:hypothetical protein